MDTGAFPIAVEGSRLQIVAESFADFLSHIDKGRPSTALGLSRHNILLDNIKVHLTGQAPVARYALSISRQRVMVCQAYQDASRPRTGPSPPE